MLIDTHCHLYLDDFKEDLEAVLQRCVDVQLKHIFMPAINLQSLQQMEALSHPDIQFHKMAGLHPTEINEAQMIDEDTLFDYCQDEEIVGVGETGLDYHWSDEYIAQQQESLHKHCRVARETGKPIILHNRGGSTKDLLAIIEEHQDGSLRGIWHCFNGSIEEGRRAIDLGLHLGIGGVLTFKNAGVDKTVAQLPLSSMLLETDAPYLAPAPKRGKRNEPAFVQYTAQRLAELMDKSIEEIEAVTSKTARTLFRV